MEYVIDAEQEEDYERKGTYIMFLEKQKKEEEDCQLFPHSHVKIDKKKTPKEMCHQLTLY